MSMKKYLTLILSLTILAIIHEGLHLAIANAHREYAGSHVKPFGLEVINKTPVEEQSGIRWGFNSGISNIATVLLGYLLVTLMNGFIKQRNDSIKSLAYWLIICLLLLDPVNVPLESLIFGEEAYRIAAGFGINYRVVQGIFLTIFFFNRKLKAHKIIPTFGIKTSYPLFRLWMPHR